MTYASSASLIWCGFGSFAVDDFGRGVSRSSSSMISWQRLMHSSQMYTPWPAISFRTCSWLFPQKEQRYGTLGPLVLLLDVVTVPAPVLLVLALLGRVARLGRLRGFGLFRCLRTFATGHPGVVCLRDQRTAFDGVDLVDDAIVPRRIGSHEEIAIGIALDLVERLARVAREDLMVPFDQILPFAHLDDRVRGVAAEPTRSLVDHDPAVRERITLPLGACREEHGRHRCRHADADRADRRAKILHRVVDRETGRHLAAWRVDVQADVLLRILRFEEQELGDDQVREVVFDRVAQKDDPLAQEARVDVVGALPPAGGLDDHGDEHSGLPVQSAGCAVS